MSQNQKTRSTMTIDAALQAAAGAVAEPRPLKSRAAIAGLAGFVLRLFRFKEQLPPVGAATRPVPGRIHEGRPKAVRRKVPAPGLAAAGKGGCHHG